MDLDIVKNLIFVNLNWQIITPVIFTLADILTGFIQAVINKNLESTKMRNGLLHKVLIYIIIMLAFVLDIAFSLKYVSKIVCIYVIFMEITSIIENLNKAGLDLGKLKDFFKEGEKNETK